MTPRPPIERPTPEWLRMRYVDEGLSCVDIGKIVDRDPKTVLGWLRQARIPTRPRGAASSPGAFKPGQPSAHAGRRHTAEARAKIAVASRARGAVPYLKDGKHHLKGVTGPDHPSWKGGLTAESQAFYNSPEWKACCREVWIRDRVCRRCGVRPPRHGPVHDRGHVHHVVSMRVKQVRLELWNLVLLCAECHRWVHGNANTEKHFIGFVREPA